MGVEGRAQACGNGARRSRRCHLIKMSVHVLRGRGCRSGATRSVLLQQISYLIHPWHSVFSSLNLNSDSSCESAEKGCLRNDQVRSGLEMIRVGHLVLVGLENFHVLVGVAIELFADLGKI